MTRKILVILISAVLWHTVSGQAVDLGRIEYETSDPLSEFYYPALFERFTMRDTTLTDKQYHYLYFGFASREGYRPLLRTSYCDSLQKVLNTRSSYTAETFMKAIEYAKKILEVEPFNIREINVLAYAYNMLGDTGAARKEAYCMNMIAKIITSTGDGSQKHPWWITYNSHADDILAMRKYTADKTVLISRDEMYIQAIGENRKRSDIFYFNYSSQYYKDPEYLKDQNGKLIRQNKKHLFKK